MEVARSKARARQISWRWPTLKMRNLKPVALQIRFLPQIASTVGDLILQPVVQSAHVVHQIGLLQSVPQALVRILVEWIEVGA